MAASTEGPKGATPITVTQNRAVLDALPFGDTQDFEDARRGFLGSLPEVEIKNEQGRVVWSLRDYAFLAGEEAPPTVNPSLWRQARLNMHHGLFRVTERIYQVRGFDLSNMTLIEGDRGVTCLADRRSEAADASVTLERAVLNRLVLREVAFGEAAASGLVAIDGDADKVARLFTLLDDFTLMFEVVEPKRV